MGTASAFLSHSRGSAWTPADGISAPGPLGSWLPRVQFWLYKMFSVSRRRQQGTGEAWLGPWYGAKAPSRHRLYLLRNVKKSLAFQEHYMQTCYLFSLTQFSWIKHIMSYISCFSNLTLTRDPGWRYTNQRSNSLRFLSPQVVYGTSTPA